MYQELKPHYDYIVFCHLRWEFVFQRPQQVISRIAKENTILFIEEPLYLPPGQTNSANVYQVNKSITVFQPKVHSLDDLKELFSGFPKISAKVGWVYSPAFFPLLDFFQMDKMVYDCMDELTLFRGANPELVQQEKALLSAADVVFTGGKRLYESKSKVHKKVFCFPSSVDRDHFRKALNGISLPQDIPNDSGLIIGYYGVIDERIDMGLLEESAKLLPDASFVMIGPLAKVSEQDLAKGKNIHYLGIKDYSVLPNYLKGFDIAMMPFAMNEATKFISPTKTLEYMAAYKPIISTPVYDVVRDYSHCVHIVSTALDFYKAAQDIYKSNNSFKLSSDYDSVLEKTSWDYTVEKMLQIINKN